MDAFARFFLKGDTVILRGCGQFVAELLESRLKFFVLSRLCLVRLLQPESLGVPPGEPPVAGLLLLR